MNEPKPPETETEKDASSPSKKARLVVSDESPKDEKTEGIESDHENEKHISDREVPEGEDVSDGHERGSENEDESNESSSDGDSEDSASISDEEFSSLLWPTRDGVKSSDPQEQMQNLMEDMLAMRQENARLLEEHSERLKKRKAVGA